MDGYDQGKIAFVGAGEKEVALMEMQWKHDCQFLAMHGQEMYLGSSYTEEFLYEKS